MVAIEPRQAYVTACMSFGEAERTRLQEEIEQKRVRLAQLSDEVRAVSRTLHAARRRLQAIESIASLERHQFEADFDELLSLPHVRSIELEGTRIRLLTEPIVIEHLGQRYRIGEFALDVDLVRGLQVSNLNNTGPKDGWDHPHIQAGFPCFGNLRDGFEKLLGECQIVPLVSMVIQFLETYTPETAYCSIDLWAKEEA